jgi:hypothetical protein
MSMTLTSALLDARPSARAALKLAIPHTVAGRVLRIPNRGM